MWYYRLGDRVIWASGVPLSDKLDCFPGTIVEIKPYYCVKFDSPEMYGPPAELDNEIVATGCTYAAYKIT